MAEELIAATVRVLLEKAIAVASDRIGPMLAFSKELKAMEGYAKDIQALLADAEAKQSRNPRVLRWLKSVEAAAYEAEYVLDELLYESLRRQVHQTRPSGAALKVCSFFFLSKHDISFRMRMSSRVRGINKKLNEIKLESEGIDLVRLHDDLLLRRDIDAAVEAANRQTDSLPEQFVIGRSREEAKIVDMLLGSSDENNAHVVSVLPIVGMGGLGKTTLTKSIYNNGKIVNHFSKRSWICVSDKFEVVGILKGILESLKGGGQVEMPSRDDIVRGIQKELDGQRFLFVLDDVWNEDSLLWGSFYNSLVGLNSANGSCCILTTRLQTTASIVYTSSFNPFNLDKLSPDDCWSIIGKRATKGGEMPDEFKGHKEEILKKCQGLPLAANVIGGLLNSQRKDDWISIVEVLKGRVDVEGDIMPILKLSYDYLPFPRIKKCFAYCSIYAKDSCIDGRQLIEFWMAEGYLQDDMEGSTTMEEDGAICLKILLQSSLLEKVGDGYGEFYQMHDLVHDLAEIISEREQFDKECRHLALYEEELGWGWNLNAKGKVVEIVNCDISNETLLKYRHARVLRLSSEKEINLSKALSKLKHVRCLDLSAIKTRSLHEFVCKLYNLQTLRLYSFLEYLPQELSNLVSLRHLHFYAWSPELKMPTMMGRLINLQTLKFFNIGESNGRGIEELGFMRNLKGDIEILNLELVRGKEEARMANLVEKKNLTGLSLFWGQPVDRSNLRDDESVLEGLEPFPTLQKLHIQNYVGARLPLWFNKLSVLVKLKLKGCGELAGFDDGCAFPNLVSLSIDDCPLFSSVPTHHFPSLENLTVKGSKQVCAVKSIIGKSSSLKLLELIRVDGMSSLSTLECFPNLKLLEVVSCMELVSCPLNLQQTPSLSTIMFDNCPKLFITNDVPRGFNHAVHWSLLR